MILRVRPRHLEWLALPLFLPVCVYAAFVAIGIVMGVPPREDQAAWSLMWQRAMGVGAVAGLLVMFAMAKRLLTCGYWQLDEGGLTRGIVKPLVIHWAEIESFTIGMPQQLPWLLRALGKVPTEAVQGSMQVIAHKRSQAIVLRLGGERLLPIGLVSKAFVGGEPFRRELLARLAGRERSASTYTQAERQALALVRYSEVIVPGR